MTGTQTSTTSSPGLRRTRRKTITSLSSSSSFSCTSLGELRLPPWKDLQPNGLEDGRFQSQGSMRTPVLGRTSPLDTPVSSEACTQGHNAMSDYFSVASLRDNSLAKGRLRKYASLDFELDTIVSLSQHSDTITTGTGGIYGRRSAEEGRGEIERRTKSVPLTSLPLWSPLKSFRFPRSQAQVLDLEATPSSGMTAGSPLSTQMNKLRKKMKPPLTDHLTATSATPSTQATSPAKPEPILGLPSGLEQIGHGIGYTFIRGSHAPPFPPRSNSNVATNKPSGETLTPRRAMSLRVFPSGSGPSRIILGDLKEKIFRKRKKSCISDTSTTEKGDKEGQGQEQDEMEAMMREMYGSTWDLNLGYHVSASSEPPPVPSSSYPPPIPKESNQIQQKDMDDVVLDITAGLGFGFGASAVDVNSLPGTPMTLQPSGSSSALSSGGAEGPGVAGTLIQGYGNGSLASGCLGMVSTLRLVPSPRVPDEIGS